jgi:hypothetical protein
VTRLIAIPLLFGCAFFIGASVDCLTSLLEERRQPIMNWGWVLMGYCFFVLFGSVALAAFGAAVAFAFKVLP